MLTFAPVLPSEYSTLTHADVMRRLTKEGRAHVLIHGLSDASLSAYVRLDGEKEFHRVPAELWHKYEMQARAVKDGDLRELLEWAVQPVLGHGHGIPNRLQGKPLLFFASEFDAWLGGLGPSFDITRDYNWDSFDECYQEAASPRGGYWGYFTTLAWIASADDRFVAATQLYEQRERAYLGGQVTWAAMWTLEGLVRENFNCTFKEAGNALLAALEEGRLSGAVGTCTYSKVTEEIPGHRWAHWNVSVEDNGLEVLPGLRDVLWPASAIRECFLTSLGSKSALQPQAAATKRLWTNDESLAWYLDRVEHWSSSRPPSREDDERAGRERGIARPRVRELRAKHAPQAWTEKGRPAGS